MPYRDFWDNVRQGARLLRYRHLFDAPRFDRAAIEQALRGTADWATPRSVAGFDESDFAFLPDPDRAELARLVADFRQAVPKLGPVGKATPAEVEKALPPFRGIVAMLEFGRYGDAEAFRLGKRIEAELVPWRPPELAELRFDTEPDWMGEPSLNIYGLIDKPDYDSFLKSVETIHPLLKAVARQVAPDRFPYPTFRTVAEQDEPVEAA